MCRDVRHLVHLIGLADWNVTLVDATVQVTEMRIYAQFVGLAILTPSVSANIPLSFSANASTDFTPWTTGKAQSHHCRPEITGETSPGSFEQVRIWKSVQ